MAAPQGGAGGSLANDALGRRTRTFDTARVVARLTTRWGAPGVREVARYIGLSEAAAYQRLLRAVDEGWLLHREGGQPAFAASDALWEVLREEAAS